MKKAILLVLTFLSATTFAQEVINLNAVELAYSSGNYAKTLEEANKVISSQPDNPETLSTAYAFAGLACEGNKDYSTALINYKKAVELKVPRLDIYQKYAALSKEQKDWKNYEFALIEECNAFPDFCVDVKPMLASHYMKMKNYSSLSQTCTELLRWYPDDMKFNYYKAVALENQDSIEAAKDYYKKALSVDPDDLYANRAYGIMLYKQATAIYNEETKKYNNKKGADRIDYHNFTVALEKPKAMYREAEPYLVKAYNMKPNKNLSSIISNLYKRLGESDKAAVYSK